MEKFRPGPKWLPLIAQGLFILFFITLFFPFRAVVSMVFACMFLLSVIFLNRETFKYKRGRPAILFIFFLLLFFLFQFITLLYTEDQQEGWRNIWMKSALTLIPIGVYGMSHISHNHLRKLFFLLSSILVVSFFYCMLDVYRQYQLTGETSIFFYHQLVKPVGQHAIFMSVYVFAALVFLLESIRENQFFVHRAWYIILSGLLIAFLFLLSSKLVIGIWMLYLLFYAATFMKKKYASRYKWAVALFVFILASLLILTKNPVSRRFTEIMNADLDLVSQSTNHPGDYFNGLQFRLLQLRIVPQILSDNNAWITGVGPGDAQHHLDLKYQERHMYTGSPGTGDEGFLGYYTHNSFLESLLQTGIIGLIMIVGAIVSLASMAWKIRKQGFYWILIVVIAVSFTESLFETQYGIVLFCFLPLFVYLYASGMTKDFTKTQH